MLYVIQAVTFFGVMIAGIRYEWTPNGAVLGAICLFSALAVTAAYIEIGLLPTRLARVRDRLFGLRNKPANEELSLPGPTWHLRDTRQDFSRPRIGEDRR